MDLRPIALAVCLLGSLSAVIVTAGERDTKNALRIELVPEGNLQVGVPGALLPRAIEVRTRPGAEVRFFSPDLAQIEESGAAEATVTADAQGVARVHVRLGANLGRSTVIASPARGDGSEIVFTMRAIDAAAMQARSAKIAAGRTTLGGAR